LGITYTEDDIRDLLDDDTVQGLTRKEAIEILEGIHEDDLHGPEYDRLELKSWEEMTDRERKRREQFEREEQRLSIQAWLDDDTHGELAAPFDLTDLHKELRHKHRKRASTHVERAAWRRDVTTWGWPFDELRITYSWWEETVGRARRTYLFVKRQGMTYYASEGNDGRRAWTWVEDEDGERVPVMLLYKLLQRLRDRTLKVVEKLAPTEVRDWKEGSAVKRKPTVLLLSEGQIERIKYVNDIRPSDRPRRQSPRPHLRRRHRRTLSSGKRVSVKAHKVREADWTDEQGNWYVVRTLKGFKD